jgi:hypothetical protein
MSAFFSFEGGLYHPLQPATAPWTRRHQNGSAVGGLLTREIERAPSPGPMRLAKVTVELQKAIPLAPTETRSRIVRDGKRQQLVQAELLVEGEVFATALGLRTGLGPAPCETPRASGLASPQDAPRIPLTRALGEGHPMQTRTVRGERGEPGPGAYWTLFNAQLVAGEATSANVRAVMAADASSIIADVVGRGFACPNVDLALYFARDPQGEWLLTDAETEQYGEGFGLISSVMSDEAGAFGYAHQTLLYSKVEDRGL